MSSSANTTRGARIPTPSETTAIAPPIWLNDDCHTQNILTCSICCDIALDPVVTPCHHIFCRTCMSQSLRRNKFCPNDRKPLRGEQVKALVGPMKRVWSETPVKCPECQIWTGSLQSYYSGHGSLCVNPQKRITELEGKLKDAETLLLTKTEQMQGQIKALEEQLDAVLQASTRTTPEKSHIPSNFSSGNLKGRTFYSSITGPFGPFGTLQQNQPHESITFGQSSNIWTTANNHQLFGANSAATLAAFAPIRSHSNETASATPTNFCVW